MTFKDNLLRLRKENNLSQEDLAEKLGVSRQAISKWETGTAAPELANLYALCELFGVSPNEILGYSNEQVTVSQPAKKKLPPWCKVLFIILAGLLLSLMIRFMLVGIFMVDTDSGKSDISMSESGPVLLFDAEFISVDSMGSGVNMHKFRLVFGTEYSYDEENIMVSVYERSTGKFAEYGVKKDGPYYVAEIPLHFGSNVIISACYTQDGENIIGKELIQISNVRENSYSYDLK